jgi:hypothetical protein
LEVKEKLSVYFETLEIERAEQLLEEVGVSISSQSKNYRAELSLLKLWMYIKAGESLAALQFAKETVLPLVRNKVF